MIPKQIVENADRKEVQKALQKVANDADREPDGFILFRGKPLAVWLGPGCTPESLGLKTFRPTRRWLAS